MSRRKPRGKKADVASHEAAKRERMALAKVLDDLEGVYAIKRLRVADWLGVTPPRLSQISQEDRHREPTTRPPADWRAMLSVRLDGYGDQLKGYAASLAREAEAHTQEDDEG